VRDDFYVGRSWALTGRVGDPVRRAEISFDRIVEAADEGGAGD
jgi:hypothetical protein